MALDAGIRNSLTLPAICAPMFLVSGPDLVREACKAGLVGGLPRANARNFEEFEAWLRDIRCDLDAHTAKTGLCVGPIAVNLATRVPAEELSAHFPGGSGASLHQLGKQGIGITMVINMMNLKLWPAPPRRALFHQCLRA